jgi:hypothetical protein
VFSKKHKPWYNKSTKFLTKKKKKEGLTKMIQNGTIKYREIWQSEELPDMSDISDVIIKRDANESDDDYEDEYTLSFRPKKTPTSKR